MKRYTQEEANKVYDAILAINLSTIEPITLKRVRLDEFAKLLRPFLKSLGFSNRKISVTVPTYAQAQAIHVVIPDFDIPSNKLPVVAAMSAEEYQKAVDWMNDQYQKREEARWHLRDVIMEAFPANDNRSDAQTDYFDWTFSVDYRS